MQIMYVYVIQILGKSFGKMYLQCITEKYKVIGKEMVFFRELVHGYEFFINFTRVWFFEGAGSPGMHDFSWHWLGQQIVGTIFCTTECMHTYRFRTQKHECYHLFILGSIYTLLNRLDITVLDIKMLLWSKSWQLLLRCAMWFLGFRERERERDQLKSFQPFAQSIKLQYQNFFMWTVLQNLEQM